MSLGYEILTRIYKELVGESRMVHVVNGGCKQSGCDFQRREHGLQSCGNISINPSVDIDPQHRSKFRSLSINMNPERGKAFNGSSK